MNIVFGGQELVLHHAGVLLWPAQSMLVVSDLHLEKGSHFARRGFFLPPYDSAETLARLLAITTALAASRILLLGDCFHDPQGYARLDTRSRKLFDELLSFMPIWVRGNHDRDLVPDGFDAYDTFELEGLTFRHEASEKGQNEISGHFHPKAHILHKGGMVERRCFIEDGRKLIMPSFGSYTGGLSVNNAVLKAHFPQERRVYMLGTHKLFEVS